MRRETWWLGLYAVGAIILVRVLSHETSTVPLLVNVGWTLALWGVIAALGRLPADFPSFLYVWFLTTDALMGRHLYDRFAWVYATVLVLVGLVEHQKYTNAFARKGDVK